MENTIGITLETGVGVQSAILHVCPETYYRRIVSYTNVDNLVSHIFYSADICCPFPLVGNYPLEVFSGKRSLESKHSVVVTSRCSHTGVAHNL